ncbi:hypothetical protein HYH03_018902 [Edaphochlamys debaryana]|uniref:Pherophorin domain-containing protein n=1 Tax=Edaphochlamys debaryana TaxID=47281 RepID=A0A836BP07_9CHLO|nr:hypothetical protein HYH03_018902 [Edaphochlamys debaryana]|eukprot:KAG2482143.1 hypothetical protein HYH03_018902 [Edaphochlamys debaryana]
MPNAPAYPLVPGAPTAPGTPASPLQPAAPSAPPKPSAPGTPGAPTVPGTPAVPLQPAAPSKPAAPTAPRSPKPPRAPPSPPLTKFHGCRDATSGQPFLLSPLVKVADNTSVGSSTYCTTVSLRPVWQWSGAGCREFDGPGRGSTCCNMDFTKLEIVIVGQCRGSVSGLTINGRKRATSTAGYPSVGAASFKFTELEYSPAEVDGATFCFSAFGSCRRLEDLGYKGHMQFAIFDESHDCCPTFWLA